MRLKATATAHANIALAKYWGKSDVGRNVPAVPSLSLTLDALCTETTVTFDPDLAVDEVVLDGSVAADRPYARVIDMLDRVRDRAGIATRAIVGSVNHFPTASGLASSASGFAALVGAACAAAGLRRDDASWSAMARQASVSAARSIYGGFVELARGVSGEEALAARLVAGPEHWDVRMIVAVVSEERKAIASTDGMLSSERTSPYYRAWVECSDALFADVRAGVLARDLTKVGEAMECSTSAMHACMIASRPSLLYWSPATLAVLAVVKRLRKEGVEVYATMDAGPHVKALCHAGDAERVVAAFSAEPLVLRVSVARPGGGVEIRV